jgi:tRNA G37 N-methylase Trm5
VTMSLPWRYVSLGGGPLLFTSITERETKVLTELAATAEEAVDIGSAYGYSAVVMASAGAHVTTIDPHAGENPGTLEVLRANLAAYAVEDRVTPLIGTSQQILPELEPGSFGLAFVDGDHHEEAVIHDVEWALKLLKPTGWLCCHDLGEESCPGVRADLERLFGPGLSPAVDTLFVLEAWRGLEWLGMARRVEARHGEAGDEHG